MFGVKVCRYWVNSLQILGQVCRYWVTQSHYAAAHLGEVKTLLDTVE